jgi:hypothetical protein
MIPLVTAFIASVVAIIAFLQWQTAREKVLLDLFDKRFAVYDEARAVIGRHLTSGIDQPDIFKFARAASRAQFLFGLEVQTFLEERRIDLIRDMNWRNRDTTLRDHRVLPPVPEREREAVEAELVARKDRLGDFFKDFDVLVAPYMEHHQKALTFSSLVGLARREARLTASP